MWRPFEFKPPLLVWKISNESLELKLLNLGENTEGMNNLFSFSELYLKCSLHPETNSERTNPEFLRIPMVSWRTKQ